MASSDPIDLPGSAFAQALARHPEAFLESVASLVGRQRKPLPLSELGIPLPALASAINAVAKLSDEGRSETLTELAIRARGALPPSDERALIGMLSAAQGAQKSWGPRLLDFIDFTATQMMLEHGLRGAPSWLDCPACDFDPHSAWAALVKDPALLSLPPEGSHPFLSACAKSKEPPSREQLRRLPEPIFLGYFEEFTRHHGFSEAINEAGVSLEALDAPGKRLACAEWMLGALARSQAPDPGARALAQIMEAASENGGAPITELLAQRAAGLEGKARASVRRAPASQNSASPGARNPIAIIDRFGGEDFAMPPEAIGRSFSYAAIALASQAQSGGPASLLASLVAPRATARELAQVRAIGALCAIHESEAQGTLGREEAAALTEAELLRMELPAAKPGKSALAL